MGYAVNCIHRDHGEAISQEGSLSVQRKYNQSCKSKRFNTPYGPIRGRKYLKLTVAQQKSSLRRRYTELVPMTYEREEDMSKRIQKASVQPKQRLSLRAASSKNSSAAPLSTPSRSTRIQTRKAAADAKATIARNAQVNRRSSYDQEMMDVLAANDNLGDEEDAEETPEQTNGVANGTINSVKKASKRVNDQAASNASSMHDLSDMSENARSRYLNEM